MACFCGLLSNPKTFLACFMLFFACREHGATYASLTHRHDQNRICRARKSGHQLYCACSGGQACGLTAQPAGPHLDCHRFGQLCGTGHLPREIESIDRKDVAMGSEDFGFLV